MTLSVTWPQKSASNLTRRRAKSLITRALTQHWSVLRLAFVISQIYGFQDKGQHNVVVVPSSQLIDTELIAGNKAKTNAILYRGTSLLSDTSNNLCLEVLKAGSTASSTSSKSTVNLGTFSFNLKFGTKRFC